MLTAIEEVGDRQLCLCMPLLGGRLGAPLDPLSTLMRTSPLIPSFQSTNFNENSGGAYKSWAPSLLSPLCGPSGNLSAVRLTDSFAHLWGLRRRPAHMQARRQRRPRQTPTMMPVTECTSKESGGGERTGQSRTGEGPGFIGQDFVWFPQGTSGWSLTLWTLKIF